MKVAVVGLGYWGPNLVRNLVGLLGPTSVTVCDRDKSRIDKLLETYPNVNHTTELNDVLNSSEIDGVVLATPISTHGSLGCAILESGKHLFVEKPLAESVAAAEELIATAKKKGLVLMVGHTFEYSPPVTKIKEVFDSGDLGKIFFISSTRVNLGLHQRDASVIWDLAPHDLSILNYWLGEGPSRVTTVGRDCVNSGQPDVAFISLQYPSGVVATIEVAWLAPSKLRRTAIVGENKMVVYDDTENIEKVKVYDQGVQINDPQTFGEYQLTYRTGNIVSPRLKNVEPLREEMSHFVDCMRTGATPKTDGQSGLRVVRALEAAQQSLVTGSPVDIQN
ncbi:MAG: Gfo/Idh/MocA family oxidoreductase [Myxococcota bacterium]|nr:Gfo/Idh/MocA family oxidoreductase [Myxococcota bacterium]